MAYWEFLLQKDGDRDWLPLETAHVEILEGRYRIVAHTSYRNTAVEIRLIQLLADQMPPKRRVLKRTDRTLGNGLMVVMPFTHLRAGSWTVRCQPAETQAGDWQYGVQLRVVPAEVEAEEWEPDWSSQPEEGDAEPGRASGNTVDVDHRPEAALADDQAPPPASPPAATAPVAGIDAEEAEESEAAGIDLETALPGALPLRLQLQQQALVARQGTPMQLQGQIIAAQPHQQRPQQTQFWLQLRDPETQAVVVRQAQTQTIAALPAAFTITISLPEAIATRLLIGELSLWQLTDPPRVLAVQGFTITINLDALLETVANQAESRSPAAPLDFAEVVLPLADSASAPAAEPSPQPLQQSQPREVPFRRIYLPASGFSLPPQIYRASQAAAASQRPLDLPTFSDRSPQSQAAPAAADTSNAPEGGDRSAQTEASRPIDLPSFGRRAGAQDRAAEDVDMELSQAAVSLSDQTEERSDDHLDEDFQSLNLQNRFWSRLSGLAQAGYETAAQFKAELEAAGIDPQTTRGPHLPHLAPDAGDRPAPQQHEVVIYESPTQSEPSAATEAPTPTLDASPPSEVEVPVIPRPQIELPAGELVAGTPLAISVRLPSSPDRRAVKFWITDVQSRQLLENPRWLMNWSATAAGDQEALLQVQVPMGCLVARFEAIAIDLTSQQESRKTTLERAIVPANLSNAP